MPLNTGIVGTLVRTELRMLVRDRRTVLTSVLLPLLITPLMIFATSGMQRAREKKLKETVYHYAITGDATAVATVRGFIATSTAQRATTTTTPATEKPADTFRHAEVRVSDPARALDDKRIQFYLEVQSAEQARAERAADRAKARAKEKKVATNDAATPKGGEDEPEDWREPFLDGAPVVRFVFRADRDDSQAGVDRMRRVLQDVRDQRRDQLLREHGLNLAAKDVAPLEDRNLASDGQVAGLAFGRVITLLVLMFIMSGCAVAATDSLAGEKERGTLETLLTTAATRLEIIIAKHLAILTVAIAIALIQTANLIAYVGFRVIPVPENFAAALPPGVTLLLLLLFLPLTALAASVLLLTSGYARTYKEAQLYFTPVFLVAGLLAAAAFLPAVPLRSAIVFLPVSNIAVAAREILTGRFDWPMLAVAWLVTVAVAAGATRLSVRFLGTEKLITATETDAIDYAGGAALFGRVVLRWFAVLWALLLIVSNYAGADPRVQVTINLVVLFFGASLVMLRRYRLDVRATLALRAPRPAVWFAVVAAVPAAILTGIGVMHLSNLLFPVSPEFVRDMAKAFRFDEIPNWQLVLFIGLLPGFFEEITFRGLLLHGLHRRLHPALLAIVVAVIFGVFHVTLPRIIPTAYIGLLLTATVLLTGSVYPAMVWHAANNIIMVLHGEAILEVIAARPAYSAGGGVALALCFAVMWWHRTPYPGLRPWRKPR